MSPIPTGVHCPHCLEPLSLASGMSSTLLLTLFRARAATTGVDLICDSCGHRYQHREEPCSPETIPLPQNSPIRKLAG